MTTAAATNGKHPQVSTEDVWWRASVDRDVRFNNLFVLAVRTTGIYCRSTCPARRPKRENVSFFATPEEARNAGFRACLRCKPDDIDAADPAVALAQRACQYIDDHVEESVTLAQLGEALDISPFHLQRTFKRVTGITPNEYLRARRLTALKGGLADGDSVASSLYGAGYGSSSRVYEQASAALGMTPATFRKGGVGMTIGYEIAECPLGRLLVAATERGICAVYLGDADADLTVILRSEFPKAEISEGGDDMTSTVAAILAHLDGEQPNLDLPLDVQATAFQRRVWDELRRIPYGEQRTYGEIAKALGRPKSARAVGRACASNPASIVIPCHRAVGSDGKLTGYRWGLDRKRKLLEREQA
jgi:AraC family transcriptional regulator of adaptative response/methylated-DNA-[protein]-cysteine methyltransferase